MLGSVNRRKPFVAVSLIALACVVFAQGQAWKVFQPQGAIFSVKLPGTPTIKTQSFNDPKSGQVVLTVYILRAPNMLYLMEDAKIQNTPTSEEGHKILIDFQGGFLRSSGTELVSAKETTYKGFLAREIVAKKGDMLVRGFSAMVGNHNVSFFATTKAAQINSRAVMDFFNSVKINGK
jgi:hypothetical protein